MSRTVQIEYEVFSFDELSEKAKRKAIDDHAEYLGDSFSYEDEDFKLILKCFGIEMTDYEWTGFWSQGDGAKFSGYMSLKAGNAERIKGHAPRDERLHAIGESFDTLHKLMTINLTEEGAILDDGMFPFSIAAPGRYSHSGYMNAEFVGDDTVFKTGLIIADFEESVRDNARCLADWLYRNIEADYNAQKDDANVIESIQINEYEFLADGTLYGT